MAKLLEESL